MKKINNNKQEIRVTMCSDEENIRKLYEATKKGCIQTLKQLMEEDPFLIQKVATYNDSSNNNNDENDPLLHLSISNGHLEFTTLLHYRPRLAFEVDSFQRTPLHLASKLGHMEIVEALLEKNMNACFVYDNDGFIPLHYAILFGQMDIMQELIKARPRTLWMKLHNGKTILHLCVEGNNLEGLKLLVETYVNHDQVFLNTIDDKENTILDLSIKLRQSEMVGYLLSNQEIKTRTSITSNLTASNTKNENLNFQKVEATNPQSRHKNEFASWSTEKTRGLSYNRDWVEEVQGIMMLVATVIATVTFQAVINPPGGVWQQDTQFNSNNISNQNGPRNYTKYGNLHKIIPWRMLYRSEHNGTAPGTAIFAYELPIIYLGYSIANMVSFLASVSVILLIISRVPLKNIVCIWLLVLSMSAAVVFLAFGFLTGFAMVNSYTLDYFSLDIGYLGTFGFIVGLVGFVASVHVIRFLIWLFKGVIWILTPKLKSHNFNHTTRP